MTFEVGDKIRVKPVSPTRIELWDKEGIVVEVYGDDVKVQLDDVSISGYSPDFKWGFGNASSRLEIIGKSKPAISEGPCRQCGRTNDLVVKSCWWCSASNPCS